MFQSRSEYFEKYFDGVYPPPDLFYNPLARCLQHPGRYLKLPGTFTTSWKNLREGGKVAQVLWFCPGFIRFFWRGLARCAPTAILNFNFNFFTLFLLILAND